MECLVYEYGIAINESLPLFCVQMFDNLKMMPNETYHLCQFIVQQNTKIKAYKVKGNKTYIAKNVYGFRDNPAVAVLFSTLITPSTTTSPSYVERWLGNTDSLEIQDLTFTPSQDGYVFIYSQQDADLQLFSVKEE